MRVSNDPLAGFQPFWTRVAIAGACLGLPARRVLHAGPPFRDPTRPSAPVLSSAVLACRYEGWAGNDAEAEAMIAAGEVVLEPAQHHGIVTPLAEVVSASTPLTGIADQGHPQSVVWAPLPSGQGPQIRFGTRDPRILERHAWRDRVLAPALATTLREPMDLLQPACACLAAGEDLHWSTTAATLALAAQLDGRLARDAAGDEVRAMLAASPLFFLTFWMAACRAMLRSLAPATPVALLGLAGNGQDVGVLHADRPATWTIVPGAPPVGQRLDPAGTAPVSPMIGDSGVIDLSGFGGQCEAASPAESSLCCTLPGLGVRVGVDVRAIVEKEAAPLVHIGMIGADGRSGLLGRGTYRPPLALFRAAMTEAMARTMPT
jgi:hypothetical protein